MTDALKHLSEQREDLSAVSTSVLSRSLRQYEEAREFLEEEELLGTNFGAIVTERIEKIRAELRRRGVEAG